MILFRWIPNVERTKGPNGVEIVMEFSSQPDELTFQFLKQYAELRIATLLADRALDTKQGGATNG